MLTAESAAVASAIPFISLPPALIPSVLSIVIPPTVTLSKDTVLAVPIVILRPVLVMAILSPLMKFTVSPPVTSVVAPVLVVTFQVPPALTASSICCLLTADVAVVPAATFLISVLPASMPEPSTLTVCVPSVAVTLVGATVVVLVPSVVDKPPFVSAVVLPAASVAVTPSFVVTVDTPAASLISDFVGANVCVLPAASAIVVVPPVTVVVLPAASVYLADVKPVKAFANLRFNVPVVASPNTAMLPSVRSAAVVDAPPLMLSCSPCLRLTTVVSSPPNS